MNNDHDDFAFYMGVLLYWVLCRALCQSSEFSLLYSKKDRKILTKKKEKSKIIVLGINYSEVIETVFGAHVTLEQQERKFLKKSLHQFTHTYTQELEMHL